MTKNDIDVKPPRFMIVLVDFKTDTQRQIGAPELDDLFKLNRHGKQLSTDFKKFIDYFKELVDDAEKEPWATKAKKTAASKTAVEGEVVNDN